MKKLFPLWAALLLALTACAPAPTPPSPTASPPPVMETPAPSGPMTVHTDWSKLGARPAPLPEIGTRWYEAYTDTLIPRDDYGTLVPYAGRRLMDHWPAWTGCLHGLMTADGVAVTDPVFAQVSACGYYSQSGYATLPLLALTKGSPPDPEGREATATIAVAAADGSWCTGFDYDALRASPNGLTLLERDRLVTMSPTGKILGSYSAEELGLTPEAFDGLCSGFIWGDGSGGTWCGEYIYLSWTGENETSVLLFEVSTGRQVTMPQEEWSAYCIEAEATLPWHVRGADGQTVLTRGEETYTIPYSGINAEVHGRLVLFYGSGAVYTLGGKEILPPDEGVSLSWISDRLLGDEAPGLLVVSTSDENNTHTRYYTAEGVHFPLLDDWEAREYRRVTLLGGLIERLDLNTATYYEFDTMECVFRTYLGLDGE